MAGLRPEVARRANGRDTMAMEDWFRRLLRHGQLSVLHIIRTPPYTAPTEW